MMGDERERCVLGWRRRGLGALHQKIAFKVKALEGASRDIDESDQYTARWTANGLHQQLGDVRLIL